MIWLAWHIWKSGMPWFSPISPPTPAWLFLKLIKILVSLQLCCPLPNLLPLHGIL
ncbi:hypothetical protein CsSME_00026936 [Camellia sinensis var. sinensis]